MGIKERVVRFFDPYRAGYDVRKFQGRPRAVPYVGYMLLSMSLPIFLIVILVMYTPCRDVVKFSSWEYGCTMFDTNRLQQIMSITWESRNPVYKSLTFSNHTIQNPGITGTFRSSDLSIVLQCDVPDPSKVGEICFVTIREEDYLMNMRYKCKIHNSKFRKCVGDVVVMNPDIELLNNQTKLSLHGTGGVVKFSMTRNFVVSDIFDTDKVCGEMCEFDYATSADVSLLSAVDENAYYEGLTGEIKAPHLNEFFFQGEDEYYAVGWPKIAQCVDQICESKTVQVIRYIGIMGGLITLTRVVVKLTNTKDNLEQNELYASSSFSSIGMR